MQSLRLRAFDLKTQVADYRNQLYSIRYWIIAIVALVSVCMAGLYVVGSLQNIPVGNFTRDPAAIGDLPFYVGVVAHITLACWAASAAICLLGAFVLLSWEINRKMRQFLCFAGLVNLILLADDALQLHEYVLPEWLGINEFVIYGGYLILLLGFPILFWRQIIAADHVLLLLAFVSLGMSVGVDYLFEYSERVTFLEDTFKLLGATFWLAYFARYVQHMIRPAVAAP